MEKINQIYLVLSLLIWLNGIYFTKFNCKTPSDLKKGTILIRPPLVARIIAGVPTLNSNFGKGSVILNIFWGQYFAVILAIFTLLIIANPQPTSIIPNSQGTIIYLYQAILVIALLLGGIPTFIMYKTCFHQKI